MLGCWDSETLHLNLSKSHSLELSTSQNLNLSCPGEEGQLIF